MTNGKLTALVAVVTTVLAWLPMTAQANDLVLVRNGVSSHRICIPETASARTATAADTLRSYLRCISGADLPIVRSSHPTGPCIVFDLTDSASTDSNAQPLGRDGFHIRSTDSNLFLTAGTDCGLQNAVYTFLESYLGCRRYSTSFQVIPETPTIILSPVDDRQVPALAFRMQDIRHTSYNAWHKLSEPNEWGLFVHTFKDLVPAEKYFADHPEYFSECNGVRVADAQLCLSNPDVYRIVLDELRHRMQENPDARYWSVSQNDTYVPCNCDACRARDSAEGSPSGSLIHFVNRVAREFPDKVISTLAYQYSRSAPAHVRPESNVNIMLCSIECNRCKPIPDDPANASFVKDIKDWNRIADNILIWDYVIQFRNLVSPFPNLSILQPNIRFFVDNGITAVFEQGVATMQGEFAELRVYLLAKLLWNPNINVDSVMTDFLDGYYGDAAPFVREYIDIMQDALERSGEDLSIYGYPYPSDNGYLSEQMLNRYDVLFAQAENAVIGQPDYLRHVQTAHLPVQYAILEQAKMLGFAKRGFFTSTDDRSLVARPEMKTLLQTFYDRCIDGGITRLWEHGIPPEEYLESTQQFVASSLQNHLALNKPITLETPASTKYHNGDASALTDGLKGWRDYHFHWLGFEGEDMDAVVDLGETISITKIETDFLQDILSWVFMPEKVEFFVSLDGSTYTSVGEAINTVPPQQSGAITTSFNIECGPAPARYVRVKATGLKICPSWHKGSGGKAWIFIDEIKVF